MYSVVILMVVLILAVSTRPELLELKGYKPKGRRVVCSLTTRPKQPHYFGQVLNSLVSQFDAVYLALPKVSWEGVPYPKITHPGVTIVPVEKDFGPITKFFGILNSHERPDTLVVVLDDDVIYDPRLREIYEQAHSKYSRVVLSGAGIVYKYAYLELPWFLSMTGRRENYSSFTPSFLRSRYLTTVCGYTGISFRRSLIKRDNLLDFIRLWNKNKDCFINDDIVISAFFSSRGIPRIWVKTPRCKYELSKDTQSLSDHGQLAMFITQDRAFQHLRDCFRKDPVRFDCICAFDVLLGITLVVLCDMLSLRSGTYPQSHSLRA